MTSAVRQASGSIRVAGTVLLCLACYVVPSAHRVPAADGELERHETARLSMGCVYSIAAYSTHRDTLSRTLDEALDEVDRIDRLMSHYRPDSPLSQLNRQAAHSAVPVDPELFDFIGQSLDYSRSSEGGVRHHGRPSHETLGLLPG
jgi:thiamine biosynthesis lipoprotein ApbE